jgi:hypothetical protein
MAAREPTENPERRKRSLLKQFYATPASPAAASTDPLDIDGGGFNSEAYLQKLYRQCDLNQLMRKEEEFSQQMKVQCLDIF